MTKIDRWPNTPGRFAVVRNAFDYSVVNQQNHLTVFRSRNRETAWSEAERRNLRFKEREQSELED